MAALSLLAPVVASTLLVAQLPAGATHDATPVAATPGSTMPAPPMPASAAANAANDANDANDAVRATGEDAKGAARAARVVRHTRSIAGIAYDVVMSTAADVDVARAAADAAFDECARALALFDPARPDGALARLRASAGVSAVSVEPEVFDVLTEVRRVAVLSRGALDPTDAVYDDVWRFAPLDGKPPTVPASAVLEPLRALVRVDDLVLDAVARTARLKRAGQRIDITALARGYAMDRAAAVLAERGVRDFVLAAGGDVVVRGQREGRAWMVGVQDPRAAEPFAAFAFDAKVFGAGAVMTSSDGERYFVTGGVRMHDRLDPHTGMPSSSSRAVSVIGSDALVAKALSRALFVLGPVEGLKLLGRVKGYEAVIVTEDNRVVVTKGLKKLMQQHPPSDGP